MWLGCGSGVARAGFVESIYSTAMGMPFALEIAHPRLLGETDRLQSRYPEDRALYHWVVIAGHAFVFPHLMQLVYDPLGNSDKYWVGPRGWNHGMKPYVVATSASLGQWMYDGSYGFVAP